MLILWSSQGAGTAGLKGLRVGWVTWEKMTLEWEWGTLSSRVTGVIIEIRAFTLIREASGGFYVELRSTLTWVFTGSLWLLCCDYDTRAEARGPLRRLLQ